MANQEGQGFLHELVRRKVVRVGLTYVAVAWVLVQVADVALEAFGAPDYFMQAFMLFAVLGLPIVLILAWTLEVTPEGIMLDGAAIRRGYGLRPAIAVLPFSNMSSDAEVEHLADGLTDHLITECQRQLSLPVTSRNSTFVYKNQPIAIPVAARELNVAYVLEGSIQKQGETIRVTAQLINGADDSHLWADSFDRTLDDAFAVQDQVAGGIVDAMSSVLANVETVAQETSTKLVDRFARLPSLVTLSLGGIAVFGLVVLVATLAPGALDWSKGISVAGLGWLGGAIALGSVIALFAFFRRQRRQRYQDVIDKVMPGIESHVTNGHFHEAFDLATVNASVLPDTADDEWWNRFSTLATIGCDLPGATISYRPYNGRNVDWREIPPPFQNVRLPMGNLQLRISAPGYVTQAFCAGNPGWLLQSVRLPDMPNEILDLGLRMTLAREGDSPQGMVHAADRYLFIGLVGLPAPPEPVLVEAFFIDRYPVTNTDFETFVHGGGYEQDALWEHLPWPDGTNWREAVAGFLDATGRPGPADWELGRPKEGEEALPVTGVSWYEAAAYAGFRGKRLPTVWEWTRAALPFDANSTTINVAMMTFSNFFGKGKTVPGDLPSLNGVGAYDMFGNVREWVHNQVGEGRGSTGGSYADEPYYSVWLNSEDAFARSAVNGFRCVQGDPPDEFQSSAVKRTDRSYEGESPVSDEAYEALIESIIPRRYPVNAELVSESTVDDNPHRLYLIDSGYGERFHVSVLSPVGRNRGASLILFPGMGAFFGGDAEDDVRMISSRLSFIISQLGCTMILPRFTGMYERSDGGPFPRSDFRQVWTRRAQRWTQEMTQSIELSKTLPELDDEKIGFLGISYGAIFTTAALAMHPEFRTILLLSGNMQVTSMIPINDSINYYPRISAPVLMMNGRFDSIVSPDQKLLDLRFDLLGTPEEHKRQVMYDAGHFPFPQHLFKKDLSDWLEQYL